MYVLKIDMPENFGGEFSNSIDTLKIADGNGCAKLYAYDSERKACLLERLGKPINQLKYSVYEQIQIICGTLQKVWETPFVNDRLPSGKDSVVWFRQFIGETWKKLNYPCSDQVIEQAIWEWGYLQTISTAFVLLQIGQEKTGRKMIRVAECWTEETTDFLR